MNRSSVYRIEPRVILTELADGGGLLLHLGTKTYFTLNETGVAVWKALSAAPQDLDALGALLARLYDCTEEQARGDVGALMDELVGEDLVLQS
ncbi:MAG: PqqD family protein [Sandaracinaceae bacterium]|nr:PqqD family protein [Sandaracinaceae bacterium]